MKKLTCIRRMLGAMLAFLMAVTPVAFAESAMVPSDNGALLVEKLEALDVIDVTDEDLSQPVTKRRMAQIIVRYLGLSSSGMAQGKTPFADVSPQDSAICDIVTLYQMGVITGDENYNFHPDQYVSYNEALVFIVNAVGHKLFAVRNGGYPEGYLRTAIQLDLLSGISVQKGTDSASLIDIYTMLEAALSAGAVVEGNITGSQIDYYVSDTEDFLSETRQIRTYRGIVTGNENTHLKNPDSNLSDEQIAIDGVVYDTPGYVYATSLGKAVRYYVKDTKDGERVAAYVEEDPKKNLLKQIDAEDVLKDKTTLTSVYYEDENGKVRHIDFEDNITVIYNGKCYRGFGYLKNVLPENGYIEALDNTGDGVCEMLFVSTYKNIVVAAVDAYSGTITAKGSGEVYTLLPEGKDTKLYLSPENRKTELGKVRVGDVATIMQSKGAPCLITVYISRDKVTGMITEYSDASGYMINGTYYELATDYYGPQLKVGMQMTFRLDRNGDIVDVDSQSVASDARIGLMTGLDYNFEAVDDSVSLRIYTQDGMFQTYTLRFPLKINNVSYEKKQTEDAMEALSGGAKKEDGTYMIQEAFVVQYQMHDGEISAIYTGTSGTTGQLRVIGEGNSFFVRNGKMLGLEGASPSGYASYRPDKTLIFTCPSGDRLDETEEYGMLDKLTSDKEYTASVTQHYQIAIDGYVLYDFHNNEAKVAEVILLRGKAPSGAKALSSASSIGVITKFTDAMAEDGTVTKKIYTNGNDSAVFDDTFYYKKGTESLTLSAGEKLDGYFQKGDVVRYGTNANGLVDKVEILTSYENHSLTKYFTTSAVLGSSNAGSNLACGVVKYNDIANGVISFTASDAPGATEYMINSESPRVICYHSDTEKASEETVSAIAPGDYIVVRVETYYKAAEIVVLR